jgi:biotin transport system substrate-specific component
MVALNKIYDRPTKARSRRRRSFRNSLSNSASNYASYSDAKNYYQLQESLSSPDQTSKRVNQANKSFHSLASRFTKNKRNEPSKAKKRPHAGIASPSSTNDRKSKKSKVAVSTPLKAMWVIIGLLLTIGSTFLQPSIAIPAWTESGGTIEVEQIKVTLQVGAVLLTGCLGGKGAGFLSQVLYIFLGLSGFAVFYQGGGISYLQEPAFGYLLGFVPGAWVCGYLAFLRPANLERLTVSCLGGLTTIHLVGILYLCALKMPDFAVIGDLVFKYSVQVLPEQLFVVCATVVIATLFRRLLFY